MSDIDILSIDTKIQESFDEEASNLPKYEDRLGELQRTRKIENLPRRVKNNLLSNIERLVDTIDKIKTGRDKNFYRAETAKYLEDYKHILKTPIKTSFIGRRKQNNMGKKKIIREYLDVAKKYYPLEIEVVEKKHKVVCNNCPNKNKFDVIDGSIYICQDCGAQQEIMLHTSTYKDIDRVNIAAKYTYDRKVHFRDCINQYQGVPTYKIFIAIFYISNHSPFL